MYRAVRKDGRREGGFSGQAERAHPAGRAVLAYLWFEHIHPYSDGNGRIGRAIGAHYSHTLVELFFCYAIRASIGLVLAAVITRFPFVENVFTRCIPLLVTTPMLALVPLLILSFGY